MAKETISPAIKKRRQYIIDDIVGTFAIIKIVALALTGVAVAAAFFLPAKEVPKRIVESPYYAPREAGFFKRKDLTDLSVAAKTVPNGKEIAKGLFEVAVEGKTNPELLLDCARQLDNAVQAAGRGNFEDAQTAMNAARIIWKETAKDEHAMMLLDRMIFAKQKIIEEEAYIKIAMAEATLETMGYSLDLELGKAPSDAAESLIKLSLMKKELRRLKDQTSTEDNELKGQFKKVLVKIDALMMQLQEAK